MTKNIINSKNNENKNSLEKILEEYKIELIVLKNKQKLILIKEKLKEQIKEQ